MTSYFLCVSPYQISLFICLFSTASCSFELIEYHFHQITDILSGNLPFF